MGDSFSKVFGLCCAANNADASTEAGPGSYDIVLDRSSGTNLGLDVDETGATSLRITGINGGLAAKWNEDHGEKIHVGDLIVQINGVANDAPAMMQKFRTDKVLRMSIVPSEFYHASAGSGGHQQVLPPSMTDCSPMQTLLQLGIPEGRAREALEISGNDLPLALEICGLPPDAHMLAPQNSLEDGIRQLTEMGFSREQAAQALSENNGELDVALAVLMSTAQIPDGNGGGDPGSVSREKLNQLVSYGFTEDQSRQALITSQGDLEMALNSLLNAA